MAKGGGKSYIALNLEGFDELLKKIENAGGSIKDAVDSCMKKSGHILQKEMKSQMQKKKVSAAIINRMPTPESKWDGNVCIARVGYKKGSYNPTNISDGYKAVFINYGTPRIKPRKFIKPAQTKAKSQIKKEQEETLNKIMENLSK